MLITANYRWVLLRTQLHTIIINNIMPLYLRFIFFMIFFLDQSLSYMYDSARLLFYLQCEWTIRYDKIQFPFIALSEMWNVRKNSFQKKFSRSDKSEMSTIWHWQPSFSDEIKKKTAEIWNIFEHFVISINSIFFCFNFHC